MKVEVKPGTIGLMMYALEMIEDKSSLVSSKKSRDPFYLIGIPEEDVATIVDLLIEAGKKTGINVQCSVLEEEKDDKSP